jgi:hypothetical protein
VSRHLTAEEAHALHEDERARVTAQERLKALSRTERERERAACMDACAMTGPGTLTDPPASAKAECCEQARGF